METIVSDFKTNLPQFNGHREAHEWFKEKFQRKFILKGYGNMDGEKFYIYHLVLDQEHYTKGMEELEKSGVSLCFELPLSYYVVLILDYGRVQFIF